MNDQCLADVPGKFAAIPTKVKLGVAMALLALANSLLFYARRLFSVLFSSGQHDWEPESSNRRYLAANKGSLSGYLPNLEAEHFQGIQRHGRYLIVSGGLTKDLVRRGQQGSQLIVIEMGTQLETGPWSIPRYLDGYTHAEPHTDDTVIHAVDVDEKLWHAGGIQVHEGIVAVPIYGEGDDSQIRFYKFEPPGAPYDIGKTLALSSFKAKAVGMCRLPNGYHILVIWDDHELRFHHSISPLLEDGFAIHYVALQEADITDFQSGGGSSTYQNVNLVCDRNLDDGVYLVATRNQLSVYGFGTKDLADLFRISWPGSDFSRTPEMTRINQRQFYCYHKQAHFAAAAGVYVDPGQQLYLYSCFFWLHPRRQVFKFNEHAA